MINQNGSLAVRNRLSDLYKSLPKTSIDICQRDIYHLRQNLVIQSFYEAIAERYMNISYQEKVVPGYNSL